MSAVFFMMKVETHHREILDTRVMCHAKGTPHDCVCVFNIVLSGYPGANSIGFSDGLVCVLAT